MPRQKYDAVVRIEQLRALIEKEIGKKIKHVQTDNGDCSKLLNKFCIKEGIGRHRTSVSEHNRLQS